MRTLILAAAAAILLAGSAVAQVARFPNSVHPDDIDWSPSDTWGNGVPGQATYTMDLGSGCTLDLTAATLTLTDLFDFDDFDDTMNLDASTTITGGAAADLGFVCTDGNDDAWSVISGTNRWIDLDLGATDILRLTQTAGTDIAIGNSTGNFTVTSDLLTLNGSPVIRGVATGATMIDFLDFDTTDLETAVRAVVQATDTGSGTEDSDIGWYVREAGAALDLRFFIDGDAGITLGSATNDSVTLTTDGTGTGELTLPAGSIEAADVGDDLLDFAQLVDAMSPEAGNTILGAGALEIGVVDGAFNLTLQLGDAAAAQKLSIEDSADAEVASVNSDGVATFAGGLTVSAGTVSLPAGEIGAAEIANDSVTADQLADALTWEAAGTITGAAGVAAAGVPMTYGTGAGGGAGNAGGLYTVLTGVGVNDTAGSAGGAIAVGIGASGTATTGAGATAADYAFTGAAGGAASGVAGTGGVGSDYRVTAGDGGATTDGAGGAAGAGGGIYLVGGAGGNGTFGADGEGGPIAFTTGAGTGTGYSGPFTINAGAGGAGPGDINIGRTTSNAIYVGDGGGSDFLFLNTELRAEFALRNTANAGTGAYTETERGDGRMHHTTIASISFNDDVADGSANEVSAPIYVFPEGAIVIDAIMVDLTVTSTDASGDTPELGIGSADSAPGNGVPLAGTEDDILAGVATGAIGVAAITVQRTAASVTTFWDGTTTPLTLYLNMEDGAWAVGDGWQTITIAGTVTILWRFLGDY